ncbi:efflux RND transporter periplasmic adaptor subunit [Paracidovorax wautersii]|uniref:Multidrug resistance efflux pump n=1 Tax=Paracidovorax wautersii TaxID=1177982 RepID=A0ABU1IBA0_9BURK|nr:efflux RND transporter periplasmic adaptor subunit [Paracidovorax wautersii]MDR6214221.1 multidrug resistance efflux pump [Paracidovorax wautersii]
MKSVSKNLLQRPAAQAAVRLLVTALALCAAAWAAWQLWDHYELAPWTRDGRVRANVVQIAPDVSGLVTAVPIQDNQSVAAGALLFEVDHARYALALRQAQAALNAQRTVLAQARREDARNAGLGDLVSREAREQTQARVEQARAAVAQAEVTLASAQLNLERANVRAPADGMVTNLDLRRGSYATAGHPALALVDAHSFYVEGYFEETKLPRIHQGDKVRVTPMGGTVLTGTVVGIAAGIADRDRTTSANLLPSVNPTFNWVRLAQRIPVRVQLDPLPEGARLVAGQTATVQIIEAASTTAASAAPAAAPMTAPVTGQAG